MTDKQCSSCGGFCGRGGCKRENVKPKEWVGLTDEEIVEFSSAELGPYDLCLEVEAKLKEKNK